jgi:hypothetical protein
MKATWAVFSGVLRSLPDEQKAPYPICGGRFWPRGPRWCAPPPNPLRNAAAGRAGHSSSSTGGVNAKQNT